MKLTKPTIVVGAIAILVAGTGVAFAATDTFITKAPANDRPTRVYTQPAETPAATPEVSSTPSAENDSTTPATTPLVTSETNNQPETTPNAPVTNSPTPEVTAPAPIENVTNVSNDNSSAGGVSNDNGSSVTHN